MVLPAFGMISEIIPVFSRKPIFGYEFVAASTVAIVVLSSLRVGSSHVHGGHGPADGSVLAIITSMLIAIPTGVKVLELERDHVRRAHPV